MVVDACRDTAVGREVLVLSSLPSVVSVGSLWCRTVCLLGVEVVAAGNVSLLEQQHLQR